MMRPRDNQRSRVYAWESTVKDYHRAPEWKTLEEVEAFVAPVWCSERDRYGLAKQPAPLIARPNRGQRNAIAHSDHRITLPLWARQQPVVLHELAHRLTPKDEGHGPRFVGVLIGLLSRHAGYVAEELMAKADEMGVRYHVKSIGSVPVRGPVWIIDRALREERPMSEMDLACWCDLGYMQVRGAAMYLIRHGKARWLRGKLVPIVEGKPVKLAPRGPRSEPLSELERARALAKPHGITVWSGNGRKDGAGLQAGDVDLIEWFDTMPEVFERLDEMIGVAA